MIYILDGNNILKSTPEFLELAGKNFIKAQHELVLHSARNLCGRDERNFLIVFFDGEGLDYKFPPPKNAKVFFGKEKSADTLIIEEIKRAQDLRMQGKNSSEVVVVSDDREIRECAKIFGATSWRTKEFVAKLFPHAKEKPRLHSKQIEKNINPAHQEKITEELKKYYRRKGKI